MTDNQELIKALAKLGYESYIKSQPGQIDIVQIVIDPEDFISRKSSASIISSLDTIKLINSGFSDPAASKM